MSNSAGSEQASPGTPAPRRGRPRDDRLEQAIVGATIALLGELGYDELTIEAVATRSKVGRPTVYRRWPTKIELVVDAVLRTAPSMTVVRSNDPLADFTGLVTKLVAEMTSSSIGRTVLALTARSDDDTLKEKFAEHYLRPRRNALLDILDDAARQGDLRGDLDLEVLLDLILGAASYQWFTNGQPVDTASTRRIVTTVWQLARGPR